MIPPTPLSQKQEAFLTTVSRLAQSMCAPFWWSTLRPGDSAAHILHSGTICYVDTGVSELGITANHVYAQYAADFSEQEAGVVECQFGSSTIRPEQQLIASSHRWDLATFALPSVFVCGSSRNPKNHHRANPWPPRRAQRNEPVIYGGFPGALRAQHTAEVELPFQWVLGRVRDVAQECIVLEPDFDHMKWIGAESNSDPGGWSGGPVFRWVETPVFYLELVGIIFDFPFSHAVRARHLDPVADDGRIM